jgi:hypothetical protein
MSERLQQNVEFDVAVTVSGETSGSAKGGIKVFSVVDAGVEGAKSNAHSTISRIRVSIPIVPPVTIVT